MRTHLSILAITLLSSLINLSASGMDDTPANRAREAERYIAAMPMREMYESMMEEVAMKLPPKERSEMKREAEKLFSPSFFRGVYVKAMTRCMTADELAALANFYSTPLGHSVARKLTPCLLEVSKEIAKQIPQ